MQLREKRQMAYERRGFGRVMAKRLSLFKPANLREGRDLWLLLKLWDASSHNRQVEQAIKALFVGSPVMADRMDNAINNALIAYSDDEETRERLKRCIIWYYRKRIAAEETEK